MMGLKKILAAVGLLSSLITTAQLQLTNESEVSILSIGPGPLLNDAFGHSAIRIRDPLYNFDVVFDYGRYDFEAEGFYLNFTRGKLDYSIGRTDFENFRATYEYQNRSITEQQLNLSNAQKTAFYNFLRENIKPENQSYPYDFFYNNCATKIKDAIETVVGEPLNYHPPTDFKRLSFRSLIRSDLNQNSWGSLGIDTALGSVIDQVARIEEHLFLPKNLQLLLENAQISSSNSRLVSATKTLNPTTFVKKSTGINSPLFVLTLVALFLLWITYRDHKNKRRTKWVDVSIFGITGSVGLVLLLLWFATDHTATANNYNLLWAFATNLLFIPSILKTTLKNRGIKYIVFLVILLSLMGLHWVTGVQSFAIGLIPLVIAIYIRYLFLIRHFNTAISL